MKEEVIFSWNCCWKPFKCYLDSCILAFVSCSSWRIAALTRISLFGRDMTGILELLDLLEHFYQTRLRILYLGFGQILSLEIVYSTLFNLGEALYEIFESSNMISKYLKICYYLSSC